jgi:hypothetical protein
MKDDRLDFPLGTDNWLKVIKGRGEEAPPVPEKTEPEMTFADADDEEEKEITLTTFSRDNVRRRKAFLRKIRNGLYIKIGVGGSMSDGGDFQTMIDVNKPFYDNLLIPSAYKESPYFLTYGGEIGITKGRFSFGIEFGGISKSFEVKKPLNYLESSSSGISSHRLSAIPILMNIHFAVLNTTSVKAHISGGAGLYFGKYSRDMTYRIVEYTLPSGTVKEHGTKTSFGYHLGTTLDFFVSTRLAFFVNARYRFVDFADLKGSGVLTKNERNEMSRTNYDGSLDFYDGSGEGPAGFFLHDVFVNGPLPNLRRARFTLGGFALSLGAKICL